MRLGSLAPGLGLNFDNLSMAIWPLLASVHIVAC